MGSTLVSTILGHRYNILRCKRLAVMLAYITGVLTSKVLECRSVPGLGFLRQRYNTLIRCYSTQLKNKKIKIEIHANSNSDFFYAANFAKREEIERQTIRY
jgi:hypothetical protein